MNKVLEYQCSICGKSYSLDEVEYVCPADGGNLDVVLDYETIAKSVRVADIQASKETSMSFIL